MWTAKSLYINGCISYPRTDNTVYPETLDLRAQLEVLKAEPFKGYANALLEKTELVQLAERKKQIPKSITDIEGVGKATTEKLE